MATQYSTYETAVRAAANGSLHTRAKEKEVAQKVKMFRFTYTGAVLANGDNAVLGSLNVPQGKVLPESVRIRWAGSGSFDITLKLQKTDSAGANAVDITKTRQFDDADTAIWEGSAAGAATVGDLVSLARTDKLRLLLTAGATQLPITRILYIEGLYIDEA